MAIIIKTEKPQTLLKLIRSKIDEGAIVTWSYDNDGDFTHTSDQWNKKAWLRSKIIIKKSLIFNIFPRLNHSVSVNVYGVYHGRFVEMLLRHFDSNFDSLEVTADPTDDDVLEA